jgi:hypothetical protein
MSLLWDLIGNQAIGFILGVGASLAAGWWMERKSRPKLEIDKKVQRTQSVQMEFHNAMVRNGEKPKNEDDNDPRNGKKPRKSNGRRPAWACIARIEVLNNDDSLAINEDIPARWAKHPEPLTPFFAPGPDGEWGVRYLYSLPLAIQGRRCDVHNQFDEAIPIIVKHEGDENCYVFANESYSFTECKNENWKLGRGAHRLRLTVLYEYGEAKREFRVQNNGPGRDQLMVTAA